MCRALLTYEDSLPDSRYLPVRPSIAGTGGHIATYRARLPVDDDPQHHNLLVARPRQHILQWKCKREWVYFQHRELFCERHQFRHMLDHLHPAHEPEHRYSEARGFHFADTNTSRMILTCTRNVRWSQCHALDPGPFLARNDHGHFEVQASFGKGKEEWIKFDVVQQTAISSQQSPTVQMQEAPVSIEAPKSESADTNSGFPVRWKSMTTGLVRTLRFQGEYIYGEAVLPDALAKAGVFFLMDVKKDGNKYVGKVNSHIVSAPAGGKSCSSESPIELSLVTPERIEGRVFSPPPNAKIDWDTCIYSSPADWQQFTWIPVS
jgi:hypothetical protein